MTVSVLDAWERASIRMEDDPREVTVTACEMGRAAVIVQIRDGSREWRCAVSDLRQVDLFLDRLQHK